MVDHRPARPLRPSHRALTGRVALADGRTAGFDSSLERDWLILLDFDWRIRALREQPFTIHYEAGGRHHRYTPDLQADFDDGQRQWTVIYEVKLRDDLRAQWTQYRDRFAAASRHCRDRGWRFRVVTERQIRTPRLKNATFLRRYRAAPAQPALQQALLGALAAAGSATPQALLDAAAPAGGEQRNQALGELWRLVANRHIQTDLRHPLSMRSALWKHARSAP